MVEPGLDRHEWESEMQALEDELRENPAEALPELDALIGADARGDRLRPRRPGRARGRRARGRRGVPRRARDHAGVERGSDEISPGDVAAAINGYRAVFDYSSRTARRRRRHLDVGEAEA